MCCRTCFSDASGNGREHAYIMYFARARTCAYNEREKRRCAPERYKKTAETRKNLIRNFPARKLKTEKNTRKRRKQNHQSTIKFVIFTGGMTNNAPENSHRRHIFFRDSRHFLCFPLGKRRSPLWKTYVSRQRNIRLP